MIIRHIYFSAHDFPVIYYNKDKKVDYQCNEKIQSPREYCIDFYFLFDFRCNIYQFHMFNS